MDPSTRQALVRVVGRKLGVEGNPTPSCGDRTIDGSDGTVGGVRVTREKDGRYRGVMFEDWNRSGASLSTSCNIPAGETVWWDLAPDGTQPPKWTFDWRHYVGSWNEPRG